MSIHRGFVHCRLEYIQVGTPSESLWARFPDSLSETSETRAYVMLYESPVDGLDLSLKETVALHLSSLLVIPPPPPGHSPLSGHRGQIHCRGQPPEVGITSPGGGLRDEAAASGGSIMPSGLLRLAPQQTIDSSWNPILPPVLQIGTSMYLFEGTAGKIQMDQARTALHRDHVDCTCQYDGWLHPYLGAYLGRRRILGGVTTTRVSPTSSNSCYGRLVTLD